MLSWLEGPQAEIPGLSVNILALTGGPGSVRTKPLPVQQSGAHGCCALQSLVSKLILVHSKGKTTSKYCHLRQWFSALATRQNHLEKGSHFLNLMNLTQ